MSIPVKYLFVQYRRLVLPVLFTAPLSHRDFGGLHTVTSAGYAKRVNSLGVQPYDESTTLGIGPDDNDGLRLSAILAGTTGVVNFALLSVDGEPYPVVTTLPLMELAKYQVVRDGIGENTENMGSASIVPHGLGVRLHAYTLPLEGGGESVPPPDASTVLNFWLRDVLQCPGVTA